LAAVIGDGRYALGFALVMLFPLLAIPLTPVRAERLAGRPTVQHASSLRGTAAHHQSGTAS
ncbi:MAG: hypothetical protein QOG07_2110, partial [Pseudonocardiales bacterium]|nr:hypothetical protein [Pseudonocardiales bacterium]